MARSISSVNPLSGCSAATPPRPPVSRSSASRLMLGFALAALLTLCLAPCQVSGQVLTIDTSGRHPTTANGPVERQYQQIQPTHVALSAAPMDARDKLEVVRIMQSEQGFAMRPFPRGHKGLTLVANGKLEPAGEAYLNMVTDDGLSAKPGDRLVISNITIDREKIVFDLNGGPDLKHRFLRHVSVGMGDPTYGNDTPLVAGNDQDGGGSRLTLTFKDHVPDLTGTQVKALLAPLISFDVKTPVQAYTDTLPKPLKEAILNHEVLVGMSTDMVLFARGQPVNKMRETDGQMPVEIWLYGTPPQDVTFVRINGNRVIRVEIAKVGKPIQVFDTNVVDAMLGRESITEQAGVHVIQEGDVHRNPDTQSPAPPPSLRNPGETLPADASNHGEVMKPVQFPKPQPDASASGQQQGSASPQPSAQQGTATAGAQKPQPPSQQTPQQTSQQSQTTIGANPDDQ